MSGNASAEDPWEFWPEVQLFVGLNARTRVFLNAAYAKGKESDEASLDTAAYLDISLLPIGPRRRKALRSEDWQRNRYFWARVGYDRIFKARQGEDKPSVAEDRGILSLWGKYPLPGDVWLEGTRLATACGARPRGSSSCSITRSFPTSTSSGSTTRATMAGHEPSTRQVPRSP
jgi:hypothetical protein